MKPTSQMIAGQIDALDRNLASLRGHGDALSLEAVTGNKAGAEELARIKAEIAGLIADREVLDAAKRRAEVLEADAAEDDQIDRRRQHLVEACTHAAKALKAAQAIDAAISAFVAAAAALDVAEAEIRSHLRLARESPDGRVGRQGAAAHGIFLLSRVADGTARRRNDRTVSELVTVAWRELLQEKTADA